MRRAMVMVCVAVAAGVGHAAASPVEPSAVERVLKTYVDLSYNDCSLSQVLRDLHCKYRLPYVIDEPALHDDGISLDSPVSIKVERIRLKSALNLILHNTRLVYEIKDGAVFVTTESHRYAGRLVWVNYPLGDLASVSVDDPFAPVILTCQGKTIRVDAPPKTPIPPDRSDLAQLTIDIISPRSWEKKGGPGKIEYDARSQSLRVFHAHEIQEQVEELLTALRRSCGIVDVHVLHLTPSVCEREHLNRTFGSLKGLKLADFKRLLTAGKHDGVPAICPTYFFTVKSANSREPSMRLTLQSTSFHYPVERIDGKGPLGEELTTPCGDHFPFEWVQDGLTLVITAWGDPSKQAFICVSPHQPSTKETRQP
jgi:hypothetical protein